MKKLIWLVLLGMVLTGCAAASNTYENTHSDTLKNGAMENIHNKEVSMINIAIVISAFATAVIAIYTALNYRMYVNIQKRDEEYKQASRDLFQAIVVATLVSNPGWSGRFREPFELFKTNYKGKTVIFG